MTIGLYFLAFVLAVIAINIWSKDDGDSPDSQRWQTLLSISAAGSGLGLLLLFGGGFFLFNWLIPLAALVAGLLAGTAAAMLARRGGNGAGIGVVCGLASVCLAAAVAYTSMLG